MKTSKKQSEKEYSNPLYDSFYEDISVAEQELTNNRMMLAVKIYDAMVTAGMNQQQFAVKMKVQPSQISKWLSGRTGILTDTLWQMEKVLGIKLISLDHTSEKLEVKVIKSSAMNNLACVEGVYVNFSGMFEVKHLSDLNMISKAQQNIHKSDSSQNKSNRKYA